MKGDNIMQEVWVKVKGKAVPVLHQVPCHENAGVEVQIHTFLTLELDVGEWSASRRSRFNPRERAPVPIG